MGKTANEIIRGKWAAHRCSVKKPLTEITKYLSNLSYMNSWRDNWFFRLCSLWLIFKCQMMVQMNSCLYANLWQLFNIFMGLLLQLSS